MIIYTQKSLSHLIHWNRKKTFVHSVYYDAFPALDKLWRLKNKVKSLCFYQICRLPDDLGRINRIFCKVNIYKKFGWFKLFKYVKCLFSNWIVDYLSLSDSMVPHAIHYACADQDRLQYDAVNLLSSLKKQDIHYKIFHIWCIIRKYNANCMSCYTRRQNSPRTKYCFSPTISGLWMERMSGFNPFSPHKLTKMKNADKGDRIDVHDLWHHLFESVFLVFPQWLVLVNKNG